MKKLVLSLCAFIPFILHAQNVIDSKQDMSDPFEPLNRVIWDFNYDVLDHYIYLPVTKTYVKTVPNFGRKSINNFVLNFEEPATIINSLILFKFEDSFNALLRLSLNSTFGLLGFMDVASDLGVKRKTETFSNVLGHWSVPNGPYLMIPVLGPRSTRILVGGFVDSFYFPSRYLEWWQVLGLWTLDGLDIRENLLGQDKILDQSLDTYIFVKEAYIQYEAFKFVQSSDDIELFKQTREVISEDEFDDDLSGFMDEID
ncbi:VacJ family lipoprotein [Psychromonas sp. CNPT3]|uniref:MlaA family lipoprotein n=1 Tax=Psychromonas sp. CNPT3 TaxID=314282 RepID=UPI00006E78B6|nr:VacJ family lipoprotein [Psychromonas sp. CNPT3]AGH82021.1 VacJ family lipoprotein [Psychromonas sp. CNPT3]